jgi:hypothetical protein
MRRLARLAALGALMVGATLVAPTMATGVGSSHAVVNIGGSNHAISFNGSLSGLSALQMVASVQTIGYGGQGAAVCRINGVGNPAVPGECLGEQNDGKYWSYWRAAPGASGFSYSHSGAGTTTVNDGWVEGWVFGTGGSPPGNFCSVSACAPDPPQAAPAPASPATAAANGGSASSAGAGGPAPAGGSASTSVTEADGTPVTTSTTTAGERGEGSKDRGEQASAGKRGTSGGGDGDGDSGTPLGIGIAAALVIGAVGTSAVLRRRRAGIPGSGGWRRW